MRLSARHRFVPRVAIAIPALLALVLAGCGFGGSDAAPEGAAPPEDRLAPLPERFAGAWSGVLPCVDCDGIDVMLELEREDAAAGRYRLLETYLGADEAPGFELSGEWREARCRLGDDEGQCIELVESGQRWFRHDDGALQAIDVDGRPLDVDGARLLRR